MIEKIEDYSALNTNPFLIEFLKDSDLLGAIESGDVQFDAIETVLFDMLTLLWIDYATGQQLDVLGLHLDLARQSRTDEEYRTILKAKVQINASSGTPEQLLDAARVLLETTDIEYTPAYPAKVQLFADTDALYITIKNLITKDENNLVTGGGDNLIVQIKSDAALNVFNGVLPAGVDLLYGFYLVTEDEDFIVTEGDDEIIAYASIT